MRKRTLALAVENDFHVALTLHQFPPSLLGEFEEKVIRPYFGGSLNQAVQDLLWERLSEQDSVHSRITAIREAAEQQHLKRYSSWANRMD